MTQPVIWPHLIATAVALAITAGCSKPAPEDVTSDTVVPVVVTPAGLGTIRAVIHATGLVMPAPGGELLVVAPEAARVIDIPKAEGDRVRRGEVLVRFEIPTAAAEAARQRAEVGRAEARLTNAKAAQARARDLFDRGVAARKDVEDAAKEIANAQADLASAQATLVSADAVAARAIVRATFDGIVAKRAHNAGDLVEPTASDAVLRIINPNRLEVVASIPISDVSRITTDAGARIVGGATSAALKVVSRPVAVDAGTASVPVRLAFIASTTLPVGAPVDVNVDAEERRNVVLIPSIAIVREGEEAAVFVVTGNKAQRKRVVLGIADDMRTEVRSGLGTGERVIIDGQAGLPDGATITLTAERSAPDEDKAAGRSSDETGPARAGTTTPEKR